jgi:hypothetical protein
MLNVASLPEPQLGFANRRLNFRQTALAQNTVLCVAKVGKGFG